MTELERLLTEQLSKLSTAHEQQIKRLSEQQQAQAQALQALAQRVEKLTQLLQS